MEQFQAYLIDQSQVVVFAINKYGDLRSRLGILNINHGDLTTNDQQKYGYNMIEGSFEVKLPTIWTDEKQSKAEAERRGRLEERRLEERRSEEKE